ncbi:MAG: hypothetical protein LAT51_05155 [Flavobacteriaceae bacterium]|nr:hypothetical protein [Flavobacteriaceae bacterium]
MKLLSSHNTKHVFSSSFTSLKTLIVLVSVLCLACSKQPKLNLNEQIEALINANDQIKDRYGRIVILNSKDCQQMQCESYFEEFKNQVYFYSKSEIFIYNFKGHLEIESIEENHLKYRKVKW